MPTLKNLECAVELSPANLPLREHGTVYHDGFVQTFVAVPSERAKFSIHLTSDAYIAPGLGMFVFIDSIYQCNRIRRGLQMPDGKIPVHESTIDFRVRQKEDKISTGIYIGRDWTFASLQKTSSNTSATVNDSFARNVGAIEVVVLRCLAQKDEPTQAPASLHSHTTEPKAGNHTQSKIADTTASQSKASAESVSTFAAMMGLFDGADDAPDHAPSEMIDANRPHVKKYWADWKTKKGHGPATEEVYVVPEEPLRAIPEAAAQDRSHQLQAGRGALYSHRTGSPKYMDTIEKPYAVFWFGYRSKEVIEKRLNIKIVDNVMDIRQQMMHKSKNELIEELVKGKAAALLQDTGKSSIVITGAQKGQTEDDKAVKGNGSIAGVGTWENTEANATAGQEQPWRRQDVGKKPTSLKDEKRSKKAASNHPSALNGGSAGWGDDKADIPQITGWGSNKAGSNKREAHQDTGWGSIKGGTAKVDKQQDTGWGSHRGSKRSTPEAASDFVKVASVKGSLDWNRQPEASGW